MADSTKVVEFRALLLVDKERSSYGLRYNDFERYRKHCANRVHRLRSSLKTTHGKGKDFKKLPPIEAEKIGSGHLQLLLFETERAWSYSQELLEFFAKTDESSDRRHAMGRIRRAQTWVAKLSAQCMSLYATGRLKASHYIEVVTYELLVKGRLQRIREEYELGLAHLTVARNLLDQLANHASTSHDQAIATVFIDEISPEIRHCAHSLGHKRAYDIDNVVKDVAPRHRATLVPQFDSLVESLKLERKEKGDIDAAQQVLRNLEWEGEPVPLRNPELVDAFLKVENASKKLLGSYATTSDGKAVPTNQTGTKSRKKVTAFDSVLQALGDAEMISGKLSEARKQAGAAAETTSASGATRDIHFVHSFATYQLLSRRTQRDLLLIEALVNVANELPKAKSPSGREQPVNSEDPRVNPAVVKIYDSILQNLNQMRTLTIVDESSDVAAATEARIAYIRAKRCLFMSRAYVSLKRYAEAVSLTQTSQIRIREAHYQLSLLSPPSITPETQYLPLSESDLSELEQKITEEETKLKTDWFSFNGGSTKSGAKDSQKPLFYDIAFNLLEEPLEKIQEKAGRKVEPKRSVAVAAQPVAKAKVDDVPAAQEATSESAKPSMLGSLLGGWWGRK